MGSDTFPYREPTTSGASARFGLGKRRQVVVSAVIEKLKEIGDDFHEKKVSELKEAVAQLELKQIELELQNQELIDAYSALEQVCTRYSDLYDSAPIGYLTIDHRLMVVEANMTLLRQLGTDLSSLVGFSFLHRISQGDQQSFLKQISRSRRTKSACSVELALKGRAVDRIEAELTILPLFEDETELKCFRITVADISERKAQRRLIEEQRARLLNSTKMAVIGEMAANIAHEINNPLAIILGKANELERLISKFRPTPEASMAEATQKIQNTAVRISTIIKSLLRLTRGGSNEPLQVVPLKGILDDALDLCQNRFSQSSIELRVDPIANSLEIECRPIQISQAIMNLLGNAFDAVKDLDSKWVHVKIEDTPQAIVIWVIDSGPLPPPSVRTRLFEPFFTTKPVNSGSGLGLSVSRALVSNHGGTLSLEEKFPNTSFRIYLPKQI